MAENTVKKRAGRMGRIVAAALLAAGTTLAAFVAPAAAVEPGDNVYVGDKIGYGGTGAFEIFTDGATSGTPDFWAYCIEHDVPSREQASAVVGDFSSYLGENYFTNPAIQAKVFWVITHSYPAVSLADLGAAVGVADLSQADAAEAAQYAIWRYTDIDWDGIWEWETPASEAVYWYLVNGANADTETAPPSSAEVSVSVSAPVAPGAAGTLYGPFVVSTDQPTVSVSTGSALVITDSTGTPIDTTAVVDGQELYLDLSDQATAGSATITATANGASGTGLVITTPETNDGPATEESHAQSLILIAAAGATTSASAPGSWAALAVPAIGTTLVDASDDDHVLPWNGGTVIDTVTYTGLTPGAEYTVSGELMLQSDGTGTGITGTTTFTPTEANGSVGVTFVVPTGYAGAALVAFEYLYEGSTSTGTAVAEHTDIDDAAQTVTVEVEPAAPAIGTTLVDSADGDQVLPWNGGTVVDTIAYTGLTPGVEYTVTGELMRGSDGSGTGITGTTTFTPTEVSGSVGVTFVVPVGYAGETLVAFEYLYQGSPVDNETIASHTDIDDVNQTVTVEEQPTTSTTRATPTADGLAMTGGGIPFALAGGAVIALMAGAILLVARRRARSEV